jgi:hypothetical protein
MNNSSSASHIGVSGSLAKALKRFLWNLIRQDVKDFVSATSPVDELRFSRKWVRLFTRCMFQPDRGTQLGLTNEHTYL